MIRKALLPMVAVALLSVVVAPSVGAKTFTASTVSRQVAVLRQSVRYERVHAWYWQERAGIPRSPTVYAERTETSVPYLSHLITKWATRKDHARKRAHASYVSTPSSFAVTGVDSCLRTLIERESGWNVHARNPRSGAYGLPQALPGSKMASAGPDWQNNPATQIRWMEGYVNSVYGGSCAALAFQEAHNWY